MDRRRRHCAHFKETYPSPPIRCRTTGLTEPRGPAASGPGRVSAHPRPLLSRPCSVSSHFLLHSTFLRTFEMCEDRVERPSGWPAAELPLTEAFLGTDGFSPSARVFLSSVAAPSFASFLDVIFFLGPVKAMPTAVLLVFRLWGPSLCVTSVADIPASPEQTSLRAPRSRVTSTLLAGPRRPRPGARCRHAAVPRPSPVPFGEPVPRNFPVSAPAPSPVSQCCLYAYFRISQP